jgi:hypothetical protein
LDRAAWGMTGDKGGKEDKGDKENKGRITNDEII